MNKGAVNSQNEEKHNGFMKRSSIERQVFEGKSSMPTFIISR